MANSNDNNGNTLKWHQKLKVKYKLVLRRQDTYEERVSLQLTRMNVIIYAGSFAILMVILTSLLIAYTPLKEYIPGQSELETRRQLYELQKKSDSLERAFQQKKMFLENIRTVLNGGEHPQRTEVRRKDSVNYKEVELTHSKEDSILRKKFETSENYNLGALGSASGSAASSVLFNNFFTPLDGIITNHFKPSEDHYGIDLVAEDEQSIKATLAGTVIFSDWTTETGYVLALQHHENFISVYKHNAVLLKEQGEQVEAGEAIAIVGESGELTTGRHLHFELWHMGRPVNPADYILF
ncbi:MAG: M23 family metallopeptidase [Bacteroidales bacterium]|nr:M23 family metallopeptidase [Bacteroidales bacterium]MCF8332733.1 M23 family metallopeptidase [Bacteroidales bacterium]